MKETSLLAFDIFQAETCPCQGCLNNDVYYMVACVLTYHCGIV